MRKSVFPLYLFAVFAGYLFAQGEFLPGFDPKTRVYIIRPGDTLWDLSGSFFKDPWKWPRIWFNNPQVKNPHRIYPGDPLTIPYVTETTPPTEKKVEIEEVTEVPPTVPPPPSPAKKPAPEERKEEKPAPKKAMEPPPPPVTPETLTAYGEEALESRLTVEEKAQPALPLGLYIRLGNEGLVDALPYSKATILGTVEEERTIFGKGDSLYLGIRGTEVHPGDQFYVVDRKRVVRDPDTKESLGEWVIVVGILKVEKVEGETAIARVVESYDVIEKSHFLVPFTPKERSFFPRYNPQIVQGKVILLQGEMQTVASYQVAYINLGKRNGIQEGDFVRILRTQGTRKDREGEKYLLPPYEIGRGIVVETGERASTILIVSSTTDIHVLDFVQTVPPPQ